MNAEGKWLAPPADGHLSLRSVVQIVLATISLSWPAFYNGFPILYPDSMTYLDDGRTVARALFLHHFSEYYGMRSFFYSLVILPFHWNRSAWPVVALQCFLVAYVLFLVIRAMAPRLGPRYFLVPILLLSALTTLSWFSSLILPDILGAIAYLSLYLLAFAPATLTRAQRWSLWIIAWWGITSHATHLLMAGALCLLFAVILAVQRQPLRHILRVAGSTAAVVVLAAASQLALNAFLYGHPSLNGERPPFLMARVIADGPGRWYLQQHCGQLNWTICRHVNDLNEDPDQFLWGDNGTWASAPAEEQQQMVQEEMPLVLATLRAYPQAEFARSASNFGLQLRIFGLYDLDPSTWLADQFPTVMPGAQASYLRSKQAQNTLPLEGLTDFQFWVVMVSLGALAVLFPVVARVRPPHLVSLSVVIAFVVVVNALVTGTLSMPEDRFQARVIWLVPFLVAIFLLTWREQLVSLKRNKSAIVSLSVDS